MNRAILVAIIVVMLLPVWFLIVGSFTEMRGLFIMPPRFWPRMPTLDNYRWVLTHPVLLWARNSGVVLALTVVLAVAVSASGGYAFAFYEFRFKRVLWALLLAGVMVPRMSLIIPLFVVIRKLGVSGTLWSAVLPLCYMPMGLYLARAYFETVPKSVMDSARIDGANDLQILLRIVAPISRPIVTAIALFSGLGAMGDYLWQLLQLQRPGVHTMIIGLMRATMNKGGGEATVNPVGYSLAAAVVLALPMLAIFLIANKYFVTALGGAVRE